MYVLVCLFAIIIEEWTEEEYDRWTPASILDYVAAYLEIAIPVCPIPSPLIGPSLSGFRFGHHQSGPRSVGNRWMRCQRLVRLHVRSRGRPGPGSGVILKRNGQNLVL